MGRLTVLTPATSANLGPGYDSFGLALGISNRFSAELAEEWAVDIAGPEAAGLRADASNPVARAMSRAFAEAGREGQAARLWCDNAVPTGRGLGSSASAIVGGLMLGFALAGVEIDPGDLIVLGSGVEGHPDNIAAAVLGGLTVCDKRDGAVDAHRIPLAPGFAAVVAVSTSPFKTTRARDLLPASVPHEDAAANAAHAALLVAGLMSGDASLVAAGGVDRIHEAYRAESIPGFEDAREALLDAGAVAAVLSGAGPTVLGLVHAEDGAAALAAAREVADHASSAIVQAGAYLAPVAVPIDHSGARFVEQ